MALKVGDGRWAHVMKKKQGIMVKMSQFEAQSGFEVLNMMGRETKESSLTFCSKINDQLFLLLLRLS